MAKKKNNNFHLIIIIAIVAIIIITLGWFFWRKQKEEEKRIEKENKQKRLDEIEPKIAGLEKHRKEIENVEKKILIKARIVIGLLLVMLNIWYKIYFVDPFNLKDMLTFNSTILLCYSFFAFITYGTPANLVSNLKRIVSDYLRSQHIDSLAELELLKREKEILEAEIEILKEATTHDL